MEKKPEDLTHDPQNQPDALDKDVRKPYTPPRIIHELELEVHAGSPIQEFNPFDLYHP